MRKLCALALLFVTNCAVDYPNSTGASTNQPGSAGGPCNQPFGLNSFLSFVFSSSGNLNGSKPQSNMTVRVMTPSNAPQARYMNINGIGINLGITLGEATYSAKTIQPGNPQISVIAQNCGSNVCSQELYLGGEFNSILRGSGSLLMAKNPSDRTVLTLNMILPAENTSNSQTIQLQDLVLTESCTTYVY